MRTRTRLAVIAIFAVLGLTTGVATAVAAPTIVGTATGPNGVSPLEMNSDCAPLLNPSANTATLNAGGIASGIVVTFYESADITCDGDPIGVGTGEFVGVITPTAPATAFAPNVATHYSTTND